ncbi:MAG TPA: hypothetical protein VD930_09845 [Gemmatimonadales bacterium]|nr:hypothetical protein [Gemmatimonadales bacterium]
MQQVRPTPFDLVFEPIAQTTFPRIQSAISASGQNPQDRDAFLMQREVVALLRDLRPDEGLGEGIDQLAALVHHGYLFWNAGRRSLDLSADQLSELLRAVPEYAEEGPSPPPHYVQVPVRRLWAPVVPGEAPEPLDGFFQYGEGPDLLRVLGVFGIHPERPGFSVVEVGGARPRRLARADRSPLFSPTLAGGSAAGIYSLTGGEELLELGWRTCQLATLAEAGRWKA